MAGRACKELLKAILKAQLQFMNKLRLKANNTSLHQKPQAGYRVLKCTDCANNLKTSLEISTITDGSPFPQGQ